MVVMEINRDGQLYGILRKELPRHLISKLYSVAYSDGLPPKAREYANQGCWSSGGMKTWSS